MDSVLILQSSLDVLKNQAHRVFYEQIRDARKVAQENDDPIEFLKEFNWREFITVGEITEEEIRQYNAVFDLRGCFARAVLSVLLVETYYPHNKIEVGEVLQDELARRMFLKLHDEQDPRVRQEIAKELLLYEQPHAVVVVNGRQFDPLSTLVGPFEHPRVRLHQPWPFFMVSQIIDMAIDTQEPIARHIHLQRAQLFCHDTVLANEQLAVTEMLIERTSAYPKLLEIAKVRPTARLLFLLWLEYGSMEIFNSYPREVFQLLQEEYEGHLKKFEEIERLANEKFEIGEVIN